MIILLLIEPLIKKSRKMLPAVNANKPPSGGGGKCQEFNFLFFFATVVKFAVEGQKSNYRTAIGSIDGSDS